MQKAGVKDRQRSETMKHKNPYLEGRMPPRHLETERLGEEAGSGEVWNRLQSPSPYPQMYESMHMVRGLEDSTKPLYYS